jgi:hypothetical protein
MRIFAPWQADGRRRSSGGLLEQFDYFSARGMAANDFDRGFGNAKVARQRAID